MKRFLLSLAALLLVHTAAHAQATCPSTPPDATCPLFTYGFLPSPAQWQNWWNSKQNVLGYTPAKQPASSFSTVASPTAPNSTSVFKMQGLAGTITPAYSGNVLITISGTVVSPAGTAANLGVTYKASYGTGTAPTNNAALAGTQVGLAQTYTNTTTVTAADVHVPFSITVLVTGLTVGTAYWIDLAAESVTTASDMGFANVNIAASEQ